MLFHVSEEPGIERFEPRPSAYTDVPVVWAVTEDRLCNYLLPRDCPRVTYYAGDKTSATDVEQFLGSSRAVVAIETGWLQRVRSCRLLCYALMPDTFECLDACAGYYVSRAPVVPVSVDVIDNPIAEILKRDVDFRVADNLWPLRDAVLASTLQFSMIRMRNAANPIP